MIRYADKALADVRRLAGWLGERDVGHALRFLKLLDEAALKIDRQPNVWPRAGRSQKYLMAFGKTKYEIQFVIDGDDVVIQRIWHGREDRR